MRRETYFCDVYQKEPTRAPSQFRSVCQIKAGMTRKDANCEHLSRFLFECDTAPLPVQLRELMEFKEIFREIVYSGKKSYHALVEFSDFEAISPEHYKAVHKRLRAHLETYIDLEFDKLTCNPSRLTRTPGARRCDNKAIQKLAWTGSQVSREIFPRGVFEEPPVWVPPLGSPRDGSGLNRKGSNSPFGDAKLLLDGCAPKGARNASMFKLWAWCQDAGKSFEDYSSDLLRMYPDMADEIHGFIRRRE